MFECLNVPTFEWAATLKEGHIDGIYQIASSPPYTRREFVKVRGSLFILRNPAFQDLTMIILYRARVVTLGGNLKHTTVNPTHNYKGRVWLIGLVHNLPFDPMEWTWLAILPTKEAQFFNYSVKMGYQINMLGKGTNSHLLQKKRLFGLSKEESNKLIKFIWNKHKTAKLQHFL